LLPERNEDESPEDTNDQGGKLLEIPEKEKFISYNFTLKKLGERQMVNSWNIKDPLGYKLNL